MSNDKLSSTLSSQASGSDEVSPDIHPDNLRVL